MSLRKQNANDNYVDEWLMWSGITHPNVVRQKDGSYFSVIKYMTYPKQNIPINCNGFKRGWAIWIERQHHESKIENFIVLLWNPFFTRMKNYAENALTDGVTRQKSMDYFVEEVNTFLKAINKVTKAELLQYQEIFDYLSFSISLDEEKVRMPKVPLYMDVVLSQKLKFTFLENDIKINSKKLLIISILGRPDLKSVFDMLSNISYRHVRRLLCFNAEEAATDLKRYIGKWCSHRKIIKNMVKSNIVKEINGYYTENFIFLIDDSNYTAIKEYLAGLLKYEQVLYLFETYNLKDVFWGCIPGIYLANVTPPIAGFASLDDLLLHTEDSSEDEEAFNKAIAETAQRGEGYV